MRSLRTKIGPRIVRSSSAKPSGACAAKNALCSFEKSFRTGRSPATALRTSVGPQHVFHRSRADEPAGQRVDLDAEGRGHAQLGRHVSRLDRPQLHDRVVALSLDPPGANNDARLVELQVGRLEEEDLADLSFERVQPSATTVERWSDSGTVSFSSTLSESLINATSCVISSLENAAGGGALSAVLSDAVSTRRSVRQSSSLPPVRGGWAAGCAVTAAGTRPRRTSPSPVLGSGESAAGY